MKIEVPAGYWMRRTTNTDEDISFYIFKFKGVYAIAAVARVSGGGYCAWLSDEGSGEKNFTGDDLTELVRKVCAYHRLLGGEE